MNPEQRTTGKKGGASSQCGEEGGDDRPLQPGRDEQLEYMRSLILELKRMAESSGMKSLAVALERAHEAARD